MKFKSNLTEESSQKSKKQNIEASEDDNILSDMKEEAEVSDDEFILIDNANMSTKWDNMDQELKNILSKVFVNAALEYYNEMEKAYYLANFLPICFNCDSFEYIISISEKHYPYCKACTNDPNVLTKMGKELNFLSNSIQSVEQKSKKKN